MIRKFIPLFSLLILVSVSFTLGCRAHVRVEYEVKAPPPPKITFQFRAEARYRVEGSVYYVNNARNYDIFYYQGRYWWFYNGRWYVRARGERKWRAVRAGVPRIVIKARATWRSRRAHKAKTSTTSRRRGRITKGHTKKQQQKKRGRIHK